MTVRTTQNIHTITYTHNCTTLICITGTINSEATQMVLDSGASYSVVSKKHRHVAWEAYSDCKMQMEDLSHY